MSSNFKYFNLVALNVLSFPIYEPLNPNSMSSIEKTSFSVGTLVMVSIALGDS
jgi:hypothetical protein